MTTAQDQQSRAEFEATMRAEPNHWVNRDFYRDPLGADLYEDRGTQAAWSAWQAARALPAHKNVREGEPYDNPAFEDLARTMGVWGTAQAALCAQFFLAGRGAVPAGMEPVAEIVECRVMGQQTVAEVDGAWKFLRIGDKLYTASQVQAMGRVPPGWQAVPLEATEKMIRASDAVDFTRLDTDGVTRAVYESMLAAATRPPAAQEGA